MLRVDPRTLRQIPIRIVLVTMDTHLASAAMKGVEVLSEKLPGLQFKLHAASDWAKRPDGIERCISDIKSADIIIVTMLFLEDHFQPILKALEERRETCDAMICAMSAPEVVKLTRMNQLDMMKPATGLLGLLKRMRGKNKAQAGGAAQMRMLRRLPKILRYIPGSAQDARAYFLTLQYWLGGSQDNIRNMLLLLIERYAKEERVALKTGDPVPEPVHYPEVGLYHPKMAGMVCDSLSDLPSPNTGKKCCGTVGLILLRSYLLAGNTGHYDGVISAMENRGLKVIPVFASGLDARPAIERYFMDGNRVNVDAVVSLTGFSLVGGPAYNDAKAAEEVLAKLDCPYIAAHPVEFQSLDEWGKSERGLSPVESTIMVAIPELDGGTVPMVFGGRPGIAGSQCNGCDRRCDFSDIDSSHDMASCPERASMLAARTDRLVNLRKARSCDRKIAIVLFNFPPNAGATGTAAYLGVFESLFNTLEALKRDGHKVDMPESVDHLRDLLLKGNAAQHGADANVHDLVTADDYVRREPYLADIEAQWGPAPGKGLSNGREIFVLGREFGNIFVGIQPPFGYEGDPMRLLFEAGFTPTHAFSAFYRYLREDFGANAVLHFGTHGALEFMPGKQSGASGGCWPDRLIQDLPNLYLYASNNPSEGALAKRRAGATLISYLTPPVTHAGLYKELAELKSMLDRWRSADPTDAEARGECVEIIKAQAEALELKEYALFDDAAVEPEKAIKALSDALLELEYALIPHGMHIVGKVPSAEERFDLLTSMVDEDSGPAFSAPVLERLAAGDAPRTALKTAGVDLRADDLDRLETLSKTARLLKKETELDGIVRALSGRFIRPAPGGDLLRSPEVLPTGRNLHGFDPFRIPSAYAVIDGAAQANRLIDRYREDGNPLPNSIAMVLWGTDNLKREGSPIAQALALMGAKPRFDSYGRLAGAELIPLKDLGRPRIDVVITISGIFRDLLPLQIKLLAEASLLAASADEPLEKNYIRKNALAFMEEHDCDLETAALRVYGNADGAYGANVNHLIDSSSFGDDEELAEAYSARKGFAYGVSGTPQKNRALLASVLNTVELTYQNLDSVELGVTTIDNYFDTLGGITGAVKKAKGGKTPPVYIGDQTRSSGTVRTLSEQVALETRTRALNPKWYEGMLSHGYEGVRQIEEHVKNTLGWSATTGQVQPWVYQKLTETFMLDPDMRDRLAELNPVASSRVANRLIEASERDYWQPDEATLEALMDAADALDDRVEGVVAEPGE
ncbi:MAG: magnesium chelatase subunit H [Pseudomonadota bacterium]